MKASMKWLSDYIDMQCSPEELAERLTKLGLEVESIEKQGENIKNVATGRITRIKRHPESEKLLVCDVNVGARYAQVVTGANNVKEGDVVPVALS